MQQIITIIVLKRLKSYLSVFEQDLPLLLWKSVGPIHLKTGLRLFSSLTWSFLIRFRLVRTLAISYKRRTLAKTNKRDCELHLINKNTKYALHIWEFKMTNVLLLYLLWLDSSWPSSIKILAAVSSVTVCVLDTRNSMTNFWLMMRSDLSFRLLEAAIWER